MKQRDDIYYIDKVLNGDSSAFAELVDRYKTMAFNISARIVGSREDAEEVAQDSFVKAYRSLSSFKRSAKFSTWLFRIVYNTSVSHYRKSKREVVSGRLDDRAIKHTGQPVEDPAADDADLTAALLNALGCLPGEEQTMITLYYYEDSSIDDIALIMNMSASNVKVRLYRARKKLHDQISQLMADGAGA